MNAIQSIDTGTTPATLNYELLTTHVDDSDQMSYTTYGVRVLDEAGTVVFECTDISTSKEYVQSFIDLVKERDVSPVHIKDILEDYLD